MPRKARQLSSTGTYHVVVRGLDRQPIFEENEDYKYYLNILQLFSNQCDFEIYAYCLMLNHVHIVLKVNDVPLSTVFKKINTTYASWFNLKYNRSGHLQQERFYSEPIEDYSYLQAAIRYIHQNPFKAGLEESIGTTYQWSSIHEYLEKKNTLTSTEFIYSIVNPDSFIEYNLTEAFDNFEDYIDVENVKRRIPDDVARGIIKDICGCENSTDFQKLSLLERNKFLKELFKKGLSSRQMNRLTGVSLGVISRALIQSDGPRSKRTVPDTEGRSS